MALPLCIMLAAIMALAFVVYCVGTKLDQRLRTISIMLDVCLKAFRTSALEANDTLHLIHTSIHSDRRNDD